MRSFSFPACLILAIGSLAQASGAAVLAAVPLSEQMAASVMARQTPLGITADGAPSMNYEDGVMERALALVFNATGNASYFDYLRAGVDNVMDDQGELRDYNLTFYTLDDVRLGPEFIYLYTQTGEDKYKVAADTLRRQLDGQPRNADGGFWHRSTYPNQMWLDGIYMVEPFYAQHTAWFHPDNTTAYDDIVLQFTLMYDHALNATSGLLKHGWDETRAAAWADPVTGQSPEVWGRALGWYMMALVDTLDYVPASHASTLLAQLAALAPAVVAATDPASRLWWDVMSQPGRAGNYIESSCSAMFIASILKAVRKGYVEAGEIRPALEASYEALVGRFVESLGNGTLNWEGTVHVGVPGTFEEYIVVTLQENDLKGVGPFVYASIEYETATGA